VAGWERPNWFAPPGIEPQCRYSFKRQNWFGYAAEEHMAAREKVALFDQSSLALFRVEGSDSLAVLQRICTADMDVPAGKIVYTQWLNPKGGIEADLTVTRLSEDVFLVITGAAVARRDLAWLRRNVPEDARCLVSDVGSGYAALGVMGPKSRELLSRLTPADLGNEAFAFGRAKEIEIAHTTALALRVSYAGELGWELHMAREFAAGILEQILEEGAALGLRPAGMHAMDSCRMEKAYRHWGHEITSEDTPIEAGLAFTCAFDKEIAFTGREALLTQRAEGITKRLVQFALEDPEPLLYHHEPIYREGKLAGYISSGAYGHTLGPSVGLGYVKLPAGLSEPNDFVMSGDYEIEIAGERVAATASLKALYDPKSRRLRG
jgi:4-methylaminobutanoate oxidase (formaldehyde-forming)